MWPVPVTTGDYHRLYELSRKLDASFQGAPHLRPLNSDDERHSAFTHTLEKRPDGKCQFLTAENSCELHRQGGPEAKPAMCRMFPYTFTQTPGGVFSSLSFASTSVLFNSGDLLSEQRQTVEDMWQLYSRLFSMIQPSWDNLQLVDGVPLKWERFRVWDTDLLGLVGTPADSEGTAKCLPPGEPLETRLLKASKFLAAQLPADVDAERMPPLEARPKIVDQLLIKSLNALYLPADVFKSRESSLNARELLAAIVQAPNLVTIEHDQVQRRFQDAAGIAFSSITADENSFARIENLLHRFVYCRMFAKQYFGPTMGYLSLLSGLHHLLLIVVMLKLRLKLAAAGGAEVTFEYAAEMVRTAERRLTQLSFPAESVAVMEVLLTSPSRVERLASLIR